MNRNDRILRHALYGECLKKITEAEADRIFCKHDMEHNRAVANLLLQYEICPPIPEDVLIATAYLHDIGRCLEYEQGIDHAQAGARLAEQILAECGYDGEEIALITGAILGHRGHGEEVSRHQRGENLGELLYRADKKSRPCWNCPAYDQCYWPEDQKNVKPEGE